MSLRVAFIGAGQMARHHARAVERTGLAQIVGVTDRMADRAEEFAALARTRALPSIRALLDGTRPDVVHVCTPPPAHYETAKAVLEHGAHVYVEKPFALTARNAAALLDLAAREGRIVCSGHQLLFDPAFETFMTRGAGLGDAVQVDSHFAFRPPGTALQRRQLRTLASQLVDILPHPLYTLIAVLERLGPPGAAVEIDWAHGGPTDVQAVVRAGDVTGRLSVSLRARPVASALTLIATQGSITCDFVRSVVVGAANPGTEALEKAFNPIVEAAQLAGGTLRSLARRVVGGTSYPGLAELISAFYTAINRGAPSPVSPEHLLRVTGVFEALVDRIEGAAPLSRPVAVVSVVRPPADEAPPSTASPLVVVTGARGFLGGAVARELDRVRGVARAANPDDPHVGEWVVADLSGGIAADAFVGADVVVHAAAETAGDFAAHQRNTIDATRHLLQAMHEAGVRRLILVSSLSVLRPPRTPWERQNEQTPRPEDPTRFGPYVWGKSRQEELVEREAPALGIAVRVIRPGALVDADDPSMPGLMGRHLFGRWHLGLGHSALPIAVCDVSQCAEAIAWCARHFDDAPPVVNLFDPSVTTRGVFLDRLRSTGWRGRVVWVPISVISMAIVTARTLLAIANGRRPTRLAAWGVLKPRRYDGRVADQVLAACR